MVVIYGHETWELCHIVQRISIFMIFFTLLHFSHFDNVHIILKNNRFRGCTRQSNQSLKIPFNMFSLFRTAEGKQEEMERKWLWLLHVWNVSVCVCVPVNRRGAVDGGPFGLGDGVEWIAVSMANHHLHRQQLVVGRTVTCKRRLHQSIWWPPPSSSSSSVFLVSPVTRHVT